MEDDELIEQLKLGDRQAMNHIYEKYRQEGFAMINKLGFVGIDKEDVFQEAVISFLTNIKTGKFQGKSAIKTYFLSILKFKTYGQSRKEQKMSITNIEGKDFECQTFDEEYQDEDLKKVRNVLDQAEEKCKELLKGFYFDQEDLKSLADKLGLTYNFVRQKKMRCLKSLRSLYQKI